MAGVILFDPGDSTPIEIDWSDAIGSGSLVAVTHAVPAPLTMRGETFDNLKSTSYVGISGARHGEMYLIEAAATLNLINPEGSPQVINRQFWLRCFNG